MGQTVSTQVSPAQVALLYLSDGAHTRVTRGHHARLARGVGGGGGGARDGGGPVRHQSCSTGAGNACEFETETGTIPRVIYEALGFRPAPVLR